MPIHLYCKQVRPEQIVKYTKSRQQKIRYEHHCLEKVSIYAWDGSFPTFRAAAMSAASSSWVHVSCLSPKINGSVSELDSLSPSNPLKVNWSCIEHWAPNFPSLTQKEGLCTLELTLRLAVKPLSWGLLCLNVLVIVQPGTWSSAVISADLVSTEAPYILLMQWDSWCWYSSFSDFHNRCIVSILFMVYKECSGS